MLVAWSTHLELRFDLLRLAGVQPDPLLAPELPLGHQLNILYAVEIREETYAITSSNAIQDVSAASWRYACHGSLHRRTNIDFSVKNKINTLVTA